MTKENQEQKVLDFPYPDVILDHQGYPTDAAINYIRNWSMERTTQDGLLFGKYWMTNDHKPLLDFIKEIWYYGEDAYTHHENGLFELHTLGWSGNEQVISELKNTVFWMQKYRAHSTGGHFYFRLKHDCGYDWKVTQEESKW